MNDHIEHLNEISQSAAALYGQEWARLPQWTKDRWKETVRNTARGSSGVNEMERCAGQAIDEWYKRRDASPTVEPVEVEEAPPIVEAVEAPPKKKPKLK